MNRLIVYTHLDCTDGNCAAWLFKKAIPHAEVHHVSPNAPPIILASDGYDQSDTFVFADVAYEPAWFDALARNTGCHDIFVLDHHESAYEKLKGTRWAENCKLDQSGAGLAMRFLIHHQGYGGKLSKGMRKLAEYVEDWDLRRFSMWKSREISLYITNMIDLYDFDKACAAFDDLATLFENGVDHIASNAGSVIERCLHNRIESAKRRVHMTRRGIPYVNVDQQLAEEALPVICKGHPYAVGWWMETTPHGSLQVGLSVRADNKSGKALEFVKDYGGGGHPDRCGATISSMQLLELLLGT